MFATAVTLAVIAVVIARLADLVREDGTKIIAALQGRSGFAETAPTVPAIVRLNPRCTAEELEFARPELGAAA
jgi:hypothetical protein